MKKRHSIGIRILLWVLRIIGIAVAGVIGLMAYLLITEYKPADVEPLTVEKAQTAKQLTEGDDLSILTWNMGFGALGDNADFFMDGGKGVQTATRERLEENLKTIGDELKALDADVVYMQEIDRDSKRSYGTDEVEWMKAYVGGYDSSTFAYNFHVEFLPYPIPPIGKVMSGINTFSKYEVTESTRYQLPNPFSWPMRAGNLKRCLMVDRVPVLDADGQDSGKELVLINLHLEAYDDGEGKIAQTKMLNEIMQTEADKGNYVIAGGDFNQTFSGTDASMYPTKEGTWQCGLIEESDFSDEWQFMMDNTTPTCRSLDQPYAGADHENFQYYMLDGFICSSNIEVSSVETQDIGFTASDHNPVLMKVKLK